MIMNRFVDMIIFMMFICMEFFFICAKKYSVCEKKHFSFLHGTIIEYLNSTIVRHAGAPRFICFNFHFQLVVMMNMNTKFSELFHTFPKCNFHGLLTQVFDH
jgi:hypothetical protein